MKKIIGLIGETGSGKDTFCSLAKKRFSSILFPRFSEPLSETLGIFFEEIKKEDQQWLANALRDRFGEDILMKSIAKKIKEAGEEIVVLNGIRVKEEFDSVKSLGGIIVYITLDAKMRWERVRKRKEKEDDDISYEDFQKIDKGRPEAQIRDLGAKADIIIRNDGSIEDLEKKAVEVIQNL